MDCHFAGKTVVESTINGETQICMFIQPLGLLPLSISHYGEHLPLLNLDSNWRAAMFGLGKAL